MLKYYDAIFSFLIRNGFGAIGKLDSVCIIHNSKSFINNDVLSNKNWKQNWKILNRVLILLLWKLFLSKNQNV